MDRDADVSESGETACMQDADSEAATVALVGQSEHSDLQSENQSMVAMDQSVQPSVLEQPIQPWQRLPVRIICHDEALSTGQGLHAMLTAAGVVCRNVSPFRGRSDPQFEAAAAPRYAAATAAQDTLPLTIVILSPRFLVSPYELSALARAATRAITGGTSNRLLVCYHSLTAVQFNDFFDPPRATNSAAATTTTAATDELAPMSKPPGLPHSVWASMYTRRGSVPHVAADVVTLGPSTDPDDVAFLGWAQVFAELFPRPGFAALPLPRVLLAAVNFFAGIHFWSNENPARPRFPSEHAFLMDVCSLACRELGRERRMPGRARRPTAERSHQSLQSTERRLNAAAATNGADGASRPFFSTGGMQGAPQPVLGRPPAFPLAWPRQWQHDVMIAYAAETAALGDHAVLVSLVTALLAAGVCVDRMHLYPKHLSSGTLRQMLRLCRVVMPILQPTHTAAISIYAQVWMQDAGANTTNGCRILPVFHHVHARPSGNAPMFDFRTLQDALRRTGGWHVPDDGGGDAYIRAAVPVLMAALARDGWVRPELCQSSVADAAAAIAASTAAAATTTAGTVDGSSTGGAKKCVACGTVSLRTHGIHSEHTIIEGALGRSRAKLVPARLVNPPPSGPAVSFVGAIHRLQPPPQPADADAPTDLNNTRLVFDPVAGGPFPPFLSIGALSLPPRSPLPVPSQETIDATAAEPHSVYIVRGSGSGGSSYPLVHMVLDALAALPAELNRLSAATSQALTPPSAGSAAAAVAAVQARVLRAVAAIRGSRVLVLVLSAGLPPLVGPDAALELAVAQLCGVPVVTVFDGDRLALGAAELAALELQIPAAFRFPPQPLYARFRDSSVRVIEGLLQLAIREGGGPGAPWLLRKVTAPQDQEMVTTVYALGRNDALSLPGHLLDELANAAVRDPYNLDPMPLNASHLRLGTPADVARAARYFRDALGHDNDAHRAAARDAMLVCGAVEPLVSALSRTLGVAGYDLACALTNFCSGEAKHVQAVIAAGTLPLLVRLLDLPPPSDSSGQEAATTAAAADADPNWRTLVPAADIREMVLWNLTNIIAESIDHRNEMVRLGVLERVSALVPSAGQPLPHTSLYREIAGVLYAVHRPKPMPAWQDSRVCVQAIVRLLEGTTDVDTAQRCLWTLAEFALQPPADAWPLLLDRSVLRCVARSLMVRDHTVAIPAARVCGRLACGTAAQTAELLEPSLLILRHLRALMVTEDAEYEKVCMEAIWAVSNVMAEAPPEHVQCVVREAIIPRLVAALGHPLVKMREEAACCLANLTRHGTDAHAAAVSREPLVLPKLCQQLALVPARADVAFGQDEEALVSDVLDILIALLRVAETARQRAQRNACAAAMELLGASAHLRTLAARVSTALGDRAARVVSYYFPQPAVQIIS